MRREATVPEQLTWKDLGQIHWHGQTERVPYPTGWWTDWEASLEERLAEQLTWGDLGQIHWHGQTERVPYPTGWWTDWEASLEERLAEQLTWGDLGWIHWLCQTERESDPTGLWGNWETSWVEKRIKPGPPVWQASILLLSQWICFNGLAEHLTLGNLRQIHWLGQSEREPDPTGWFKGWRNKLSREEGQISNLIFYFIFKYYTIQWY